MESFRLTDVEFVEYTGYQGGLTDPQQISTTVEDVLKLLESADEAARLLKTLMNDNILPKYDLTPL